MELFSALKEFTTITQSLGFLGILFFVWWQAQKERKNDNEKWEERFRSIVKMYEESVRRYEDNVRLVKNYEALAGELSATIALNTQAWTKLTTIIELKGNIYGS